MTNHIIRCLLCHKTHFLKALRLSRCDSVSCESEGSCSSNAVTLTLPGEGLVGSASGIVCSCLTERGDPPLVSWPPWDLLLFRLSPSLFNLGAFLESR